MRLILSGKLKEIVQPIEVILKRLKLSSWYLHVRLNNVVAN
jgi:hypothetical protein